MSDRQVFFVIVCLWQFSHHNYHPPYWRKPLFLLTCITEGGKHFLLGACHLCKLCKDEMLTQDIHLSFCSLCAILNWISFIIQYQVMTSAPLISEGVWPFTDICEPCIALIQVSIQSSLPMTMEMAPMWCISSNGKTILLDVQQYPTMGKRRGVDGSW